jgi:hypothetical protein
MLVLEAAVSAREEAADDDDALLSSPESTADVKLI